MLALITTSNWPSCEKSSAATDCSIGQSCTHIFGYGIVHGPRCLDCYYLSDVGGSGRPWLNALAGGLQGMVNATTECAATLYGAGNVHLFNPHEPRFLPDNDTAYTFEHCTHARAAGGKMSQLDDIILQIAFLFVAFQLALAAKEHDTCTYTHFRRRITPVPAIAQRPTFPARAA